MAKQQSFAEKAAKKKKKDLSTYVKYIKSVKSDKTGYWRFNEQMIEVKEGENLDDALKRMDEVAQVFDMNIPVVETPADGNTIEKDETDGQEKSEDVVAEESAIEINEPVASEQTEKKSELEIKLKKFLAHKGPGILNIKTEPSPSPLTQHILNTKEY